jgi:hypothetical protein
MDGFQPDSYRAELALRTKNRALARSSLALAHALALADDVWAALAEEFAHTTAIVEQEREGSE